MSTLEYLLAATSIALPADTPDDFPLPMPISFLSLPAELRIKVYKNIVAAMSLRPRPYQGPAGTDKAYMRRNIDRRLPTSHRLYNYRGLILSNKQINAEFDAEWAKLFNPWLRTVVNQPDLSAPTVTKLSDSACLRIGIAKPPGGWLDYQYVAFYLPISRLVQNLPSFVLRANSPDAKDTSPLPKDKISRLKIGSKGRNASLFLHTMKLIAVTVDQEALHTRQVLIGEDYGATTATDMRIKLGLLRGTVTTPSLGMHYAWKDIVQKRTWEGDEAWRDVAWRRRVFRWPTGDDHDYYSEDEGEVGNEYLGKDVIG